MRTYWLVWLLSWSVSVYGQATVSGFVSDAQTGERLIGASVYLPGSKRGTTTNAEGYYTIRLAQPSAQLRYSFLGYTTAEQPITATATAQRIDIRLLSKSTSLTAVTVSGQEADQADVFKNVGFHLLSAAQIKQVPALLGETDPIKVLQLLPGMKGGREGSSDLHVRGGGPGQNLILLDRVPVYNINHLFGFFSVFNADAIRQVQTFKGGFPARFGGRVSSVIDVRLKEGNQQRTTAEGAIGLLSSKILVEGPIRKDQTSFLVSLRYTYPTQLLNLAQHITNAPSRLSAGFYDLNAKLTHTLSAKDKLSMGVYAGRDGFRFTSSSNASLRFRPGNLKNTESFLNSWGNLTVAAHWNRVVSDRIFATTSVYHTTYQLGLGGEVNAPANGFDYTASQQFNSAIRDWGLQSDWEIAVHPKHTIRVGTNLILHHFTVGKTQLNREWQYLNGQTVRLDTTLSAQPIRSAEIDVYAEDQWRIRPNLTLNAGIRQAFVQTEQQLLPSFQPRIAADWQLPNGWFVQGSYTKMAQALHLLSNTGAGMPTDIWVPATAQLPIERGRQWALGISKNWTGRNAVVETRLEAYHKSLTNVIEYEEGVDVLSRGPETNFFRDNGYESWQNRVALGRGESYGVEWMLHKKTGKLTGWLAYTLAWANRQFETLNRSNWFPYRYDRRHDVSIVGTWAFSPTRRLSWTWVYASPNALTFPTGQYLPFRFDDVSTGGTISYLFPADDFPARNNLRARAYHRLDVSYARTKRKKYGDRTWVIGVYNLYNRANIFTIGNTSQNTISPTDFSTPSRGLVINSLFTIIPSVSYQVKFL